MRGAKSAKWVAGAIVVALAATACGGGDDSAGDDMNKGKADPNGIVTAQLSEPQNPLQPANASAASNHHPGAGGHQPIAPGRWMSRSGSCV